MEDLFKKVTVIPDGKNHGLIFVLDWSGSMAHVLQNTIKQLYNLVWFCRKVNIPYDVYAFTNEWKDRDYDLPHKEDIDQLGVFHVSSEFALMNILTSKVNRKELQRQMETMFIIASSLMVSIRDGFSSPSLFIMDQKCSLGSSSTSSIG